MNKFIKEQLNKCKTKLPDWDDNTTNMIISSNHITIENTFNSKQGQKIEIKNYIINEPVNFTLSSNWNNGTKPPETYMYITIINRIGKMYQVTGVGVTTGIQWTGWLPERGFEILPEVTT